MVLFYKRMTYSEDGGIRKIKGTASRLTPEESTEILATHARVPEFNSRRQIVEDEIQGQLVRTEELNCF